MKETIKNLRQQLIDIHPTLEDEANCCNSIKKLKLNLQFYRWFYENTPSTTLTNAERRFSSSFAAYNTNEE